MGLSYAEESEKSFGDATNKKGARWDLGGLARRLEKLVKDCWLTPPPPMGVSHGG